MKVQHMLKQVAMRYESGGPISRQRDAAAILRLADALDEEGARVRPGPTQVKLWPASSEALGLSYAVEPILDGFAKGIWHGAPPAEAKAPVALVCSLGWGDAIEVTPLTASAAFSAVFAHVYAPRFLRAAVSGSLVAPVARLVASVRVADLSRPADLGRVEETVAALEAAVGG